MSLNTAVIVGAGSAGCVIARRLADARVNVTILEAGAEDTNAAIYDPARMAELWHSPDDWDYYTVPQVHAGDRRLHLPRGKVLGGSHALNAMIWVRGAPWDFDNWAAMGNDGWAWNDVLPIYRDIETFTGRAASGQRGTDGLLPVTDDYRLTPIQQSIVDAYVEEGLDLNPDYNSGSLDGVAQQQVTMRDNIRVSTWKAYLEPVRDRVSIVTGAHVHSVIVDGGRAVGVRYRAEGKDHELRADEVVLSAGALDTPAILQRTGIGPRDLLERLDIDVILDSPGVGENLHDHLLSPVIFTTESPIDPPSTGVSATQTHTFWRSRPGLDVPDTQPINFSVPMFGDDLTPTSEWGFSLMAGMLTPPSRGRLEITGPGLDDPVSIDLNALADAEDIRSLVASVRQCRSVGRQPALAERWGATELYPGVEVDDEDVEDYVRSTAITYHHQVGTCRMGADEDAVVDPRLRVRGIDGLTIGDASIMPQVTSGNTNAPSVLIGEQAARFILGR